MSKLLHIEIEIKNLYPEMKQIPGLPEMSTGKAPPG